MGPILPGGVFRLDPPPSSPHRFHFLTSILCSVTSSVTEAALMATQPFSPVWSWYLIACKSTEGARKALFLPTWNLHLGIFFEDPPKLLTEMALLWMHNPRCLLCHQKKFNLRPQMQPLDQKSSPKICTSTCKWYKSFSLLVLRILWQH